jgi:5-methyltetrahydrofolate--homocysteine methyltransferase
MVQGDPASFLAPIRQAVLDGDWRSINGLVEAALAAGVSAETLLDHAMTPAMDEVGERFSEGVYYLPELVLAARAMKMGLELIKPRFVVAVRDHRPAVVGMSGLLTTTVQNMPLVVKALEEANLRDKVLVAMGGTCVTREFARAAGADIWAEDAASAVKEFNSALNRR